MTAVGPKGCLVNIALGDPYLMVATLQDDLRKYLCSIERLQNVVNGGHRKAILDRHLVESPVIHT